MRSRSIFTLCALCAVGLTGMRDVGAQQSVSPLPPAPPPPVIPPVTPLPPPLFSDRERSAVVAYWNAPGRYEAAAPPEAAAAGPWQVRLTPEGSTWLLAYQRAVRGAGKVIPPTQDATAAATGPEAEWESWLGARIAFDRYQAGLTATRANAAVLKSLVLTPLVPPALPPLSPGPIPPALFAACGNPPRFASVVAPLQYLVRFDDSRDPYTYQDNVNLRARYAYYRFPQGTVAYGQKLKDIAPSDLDRLFQKAGFTPSEQRVFTAVSGLEGGFETVNTYDTGYVSVGFIQFITLDHGHADLARVMAQEKLDNREDYQSDFRRLGMDIQPFDNTLTVLDPATGAELVGSAAVMKVIEDKRLTAIFQRAGRRSEAFRVAQIKTARASYWPASDPVPVTLPNGTFVTGVVSDFIKSEAGLATLLDRKVNIGNIRLLTEVVARTMAAHDVQKLADLAPHEREIIAAMRYRSDFLADQTLSQPK
ncbi:MAG: hypothetical protein H7Z41_00275 [Cytophagales bacterium]|nr:hypothetical protein [Armatimonadota bacterium]